MKKKNKSFKRLRLEPLELETFPVLPKDPDPYWKDLYNPVIPKKPKICKPKNISKSGPVM